MTFFDKKEEVINIELTPYGKYLLGKGKFKPHSYQFFDDDILYDSLYAGFSETQGATQIRIKETPRTHLQYSFSSAETQMKKNVEMFRSGKEKNRFSDKFLPTAEKHYSLCAPIGTSDLSTDKMPSWNVNFLKGNIVSNQRFVTGSHQTTTTPRIAVAPITFETYPVKNIQEFGGDINSITNKFEDGSSIQIDDDFVIIDIKEENTPFSNENYNIEVFLIDKDLNDDRRNKVVLVPLFFEKKKKQVVNNILLDTDENSFISSVELSPSFVEHYFNLYVDREINPDTLCKILTEEQIIALNASGEFRFDCLKQESPDQHISDVSKEDIEC